jgi:hypothetical protein
MTHHAHNEPKLHWKWVILSVAAGLIIVGSSYFIVAPKFQNDYVQALVLLVGFIVTGAIIGYFSPGITIKEASVGGALVMILMLVLFYILKLEQHFFTVVNLLLMILGVGFSWVGGWAGEKLQGDEDSAKEIHIKKFLWKWVLVGVIIGFALNILLVFLFSSFFPLHIGRNALIAFNVSFVIAGFIIGFKSPGETLKEPAVAGLLIVILDWIYLKFLITLSVSAMYLIFGLLMGFMMTLFGAWLGEKYQASSKKKN